MEPTILDVQMGKELEGNGVVLMIKTPWPSVARMVHHDHDGYV